VSQETWKAVDGYIAEKLVSPDPALDAATAASAAAGLPQIAVSPAQGKLLQILARSIGARRILEIGTLGGYSTIWLARALPPGGRLVTLEANPDYAEVAGANIANAGLSDTVELRLGRALDTLPHLAAEAGQPGEPFDFIFIDADKQNTPEYFTWVLELVRPGGLIVTDNVIRDGAVIDSASEDPVIRGARRFHDMLAAGGAFDGRVSATTIQTVGVKGYDGFTVALVEPR
jgi:predicted O-methyltransferase YrrM